MAIQLQAGLGVSTATDHVLLMLQNGELSDVSRELTALVEAYKGKGAQDYVNATAALVRQVEMKWCQLASSRQITDLNDGADGNATSLVAPAAALGFGYMWSKGLSFMDLMCATLSTAISNLAEHLEQVSDALAAARKHLTQRIKNLDGEMEQQMEISKFIRSDVRHEPVNGDHDNLSQLGYDLDSLNQMVSGMNGKIMTSDEKQDPTNLGVWHLCNKADGHKISGKAQGVKEIADNLFPEDVSVGSYNQPRRLTRYTRRLTRYSRRVTRRNTVVE